MDCIVHGVAKSRTQLVNCHFFTKKTSNKGIRVEGVPEETRHKDHKRQAPGDSTNRLEV